MSVVLLWYASVLAVFGLVFVLFYPWDALGVFWQSHFSEGTRAAVVPKAYGFRLESLLDQLSLSIPAAIGLFCIAYQRRWDLLFPYILLLTTLAIHLWHRPYWHYYVLHLSIPLAWLGALGLVELFRALWRQNIAASWAAKIRVGIGLLVWSAAVSLALTLAPEQIWNEALRIRAAPTAAQDSQVLAFSHYAPQTRWIFTDRLTAAFWAGLPVPPELAVIPQKRIWSGQIHRDQILRCLERYRPELILLHWNWITKFGLSDYLQAHYQPDPATEQPGLYLRK